MDVLKYIVVKGGWVFAILNAVLIPVHIMLLRRSWRIADRFQVIHGLPMVAHSMKVQRDGDKAAYRQIFICAALCIFLGTSTIINLLRYLA